MWMFVLDTNMYVPVYFSCAPTHVLAPDRLISMSKEKDIIILKRLKFPNFDYDVSTYFNC